MSSTPVTIRRARPEDAAALGKLGALLLRAHYAFDPQRFMAPGEDPESGYAWFLRTQLRDPDTAVFVAERPDDGAIVGYVFAGIEPRSWKELRDAAGFVHDLIVAPAARSTGAGTLLMEAAADWLRERGMPRVVLWTAASNDEAQRLFARLGFRRTMIEMTREL